MTDSPDISQIEQFLQHAEARMMQAEMVEEEVRDQLYQEATDLLIRSEKLMKGSGAWLMSCMHARRENRDMCLQWLERALGARMLPEVQDIREHPHFKLVRETEWFIAWATMRERRN